jgi:V8-like Glu-specific endopeptidase
MRRVLSVLIAAFFSMTLSHAMVSDGIHKREDYIKFAKSQDHFKAVCYVFNHSQNTLQTGVLIAPTLVLTAAHGLMDDHPNSQRISVGFGDKINSLSIHSYRVTSIHIHSEYRRGHDHHSPKVDLAIVRLDRPVEGVKPIPLVDQFELRSNDTFSVATFGGMDYTDTRDFDKRAFVMPEWDRVAIDGRDPDSLMTEKRVILGSIFFAPCTDAICTFHKTDPESKQRGQEANKNWHRLGNPPFALAMPGTSGAPVFIKRKYKDHELMFVVGLISSFSHLSDTSFKYTHGKAEAERLVRKNVNKVYNRYQTLFVLPYIAKIDPIKPTDIGDRPIHLTIDPEVRRLVEESSKEANPKSSTKP